MIPHKPPLLNFLLHPMTTLTQGKTQQKSNFPLSADCQPVGRGETPSALELRSQMSATQEKTCHMQESVSDRGLPLSF